MYSYMYYEVLLSQNPYSRVIYSIIFLAHNIFETYNLRSGITCIECTHRFARAGDSKLNLMDYEASEDEYMHKNGLHLIRARNIYLGCLYR